MELALYLAVSVPIAIGAYLEWQGNGRIRYNGDRDDRVRDWLNRLGYSTVRGH